MTFPLYCLDAKRELSERTRQLCDVWPEHWNFDLKNFHEETEIGATLRAFAGEICENLKAGRGLILWGPFHTGKTVAATVLLKEAMAWGAHGMMLHMNQLGEAIIEHKRTAMGEEIWKRVYEAHVLVIDELKAVAPGFADKVADLIRFRAGNRLSTFVTTNLKPVDLEGLLNHGTYQKLADKSKTIAVTGWNE
jgi:DNA replication protein DnaC